MKRKTPFTLFSHSILPRQRMFLSAAILSGLCLLGSCREITVESLPRNPQTPPSEPLIEAQRLAAQRESESIEAFVKRSGWPMKETPRGVWYYIYRSTASNKAPMIAQGDVIQMEYYLQLLNGQIIESSKENGPKTIQVGYSDIESGLDEALLLMHRGDCAKILIPSLLGHGFSGDGSQVPPGASLLYDIKIL